jgi:PAS domain S-box-containing protein
MNLASQPPGVVAARAIHEFATSLVNINDEREILWDICRKCISVLGFEDAVIYLVDPQRRILVQRAAYGPKNDSYQQVLAPLQLPIGRGIVGAAALTGESQLVQDTRLDPRYIVDDQPRLSELAVPILHGGELLGVIDSEHSLAGFFSEEHTLILETVGAITALKLARWRAEQELRELNRGLEDRIQGRTSQLTAANEQLRREVTERVRTERVQRALFEISEAAHRTDDLASLYERLHAIVGTLMPAANFYIALHDPATGEVSFPYHKDEIDPPPASRRSGRGITEYVLRTGQPLRADLGVIALLQASGEYVQTGAPASVWLGAPLQFHGRTFGVLAVQDHHDASILGESDLQILGFVAGQIALAIQRKRDAEDLRFQTRRLRESEERFARTFRAIPANVSVVRMRDGQFIEVNEHIVHATGWTRDELLGRTTADLGMWVHDAERAEFFRRLELDGYVRAFEATFRGKGNRIETALVSAEVIEIEGEPCILALSLFISDRKRAEEELLRSLARERELSRLKSSFVALVSHEFRTPLGVIHSSAEILERYLDRLAPEERREHLGAIQTNAWRMTALMEEVLIFGKVEAGRLEFRPVPFDLAEACRRWVEEALLATDDRCPIDFHSDLSADPALGDGDLVRHVVSNLLSNAIKYSPAGGGIQFSVGKQHGDAVFVVEDSGIGIPVADRDHLFTAFHRGSNVRNIPGTGLGMVVIKHCLDLHGGTIQITGREPRGTRVEVRIPLYRAESDTARLRRQRASAGDG